MNALKLLLALVLVDLSFAKLSDLFREKRGLRGDRNFSADARSLQKNSMTPVLTEDVLTTPFNTVVTIPLTKNANGEDLENLTLLSTTQPRNGKAVIIRTESGEAAIKYNPNNDFIGDDEFFYTVTNGKSGYGVVRVIVRVLSPDPSITKANDDLVSISVNKAVTIRVLDNDTVRQGAFLKIASATSPSHGSAVVNEDQETISYTPSKGYMGIDQFHYTAMDTNNERSSAMVTIRVDPSFGTATTAVDDVVSTPVNEAVTVHVLDNDIVGRGTALSIVSTTIALHGSLTVSLDHTTLTYTPNQNFVGTEKVSYTVMDANNARSTAIVTIHVVPNEVAMAREVGEP